MVEQMVRLAYHDKTLISYELIAGGCINLNFKILLEDRKNPLILRVYLGDKDAAYREQKLGVLLKKTIPVPLTYYIGNIGEYPFAITEFMPGIALRDLLLGDVSHDISQVMHEVGAMLAKIAKYKFSEAGFFDKELNIAPYSSSENHLTFAQDCLKHETVSSMLTADSISKISQVLIQYSHVISKIGRVPNKYGHLFPDESEKHLVHADFDPANILVHHVDGTWKVSGVLDWEFSFSGSILCDVANMIRYAHKMPSEFQDAFLRGLTSHGVQLPKNWRITTQLLNLLALLDCLKRSDPQNCPNRCAGICELMHYILSHLSTIANNDSV
jgi:Ser/Thr protein kinase RdoA (MazF antagonist)